ncbi:MAG: U32 family peptidase [Clostridia bacterium]|nr:U32 family peptidase [Clostridia bacterium]
MSNRVELLSPVGDFDCLKAAIQNGADSVYLGADSLSARASATNFSLENLPDAINYAKLRNVQTHLTLNTLIENNELEEALEIAKTAYEAGIDAIIVQDLGLARYLIKNFPDLPIHASTQMTIYNLEGAKMAEEMGFSRAVLSRELSLPEIEHICKNCNIEIETFIHGALCISYSGQCLLSSAIGGRSGNRGKCAGPCRLPYSLVKSDSVSKETIDEGYLLSTRDVCGLEFIPALIKAGVKCFKIEGRMKTPEYVAIVTKIYRKYIDLALSGKPYTIDYADTKALMQVFNRGGFSTGHLTDEYNNELVFPEKPNNMGLYLGRVQKINQDKGHITLSSKETLSIGDTISLEHETGTYTISELMLGNSNIEESSPFQPVTIGRMKGNIVVGDKIYKMSNKELTRIALETINKENKKIHFNCLVSLKLNKPISMSVASVTQDSDSIYSDIYFSIDTDAIPVEAINAPLTEDRVIAQISKTKNTPFEFDNIKVEMDNNIFLPSISSLNELRRLAIEKIETVVENRYYRELDQELPPIWHENGEIKKKNKKSISVLFNNLNPYLDYSLMEKVDRVYIPYKYFIDTKYTECITLLSKKFDVYLYMPTVSKKFINYNYDKILTEYPKIKGFVLSNISHLKLIEKYGNKYDYIANYTMNIFNDLTLDELSDYGIKLLTLSPELNKENLNGISGDFETEIIAYGNLPLMNMNYCLLGKSNKCYMKCDKKCNDYADYHLKDRLGFNFKIQAENGITTMFNSKTTSIETNDINVSSIRLDFLDESLSDINEAIRTHKEGNKLEGDNYTNGNLNKEV